MIRCLAAAAVAAVLLCGLSLLAENPPAAPVRYVAHEWGTFTSMQGSDGVSLEGLQHEEEGLPDFVYSRTEIRECPLRKEGYKGLEVPVENVTKKMETPVIYFYADAPLHVRTRVCFNHGLMTQWFPVCDTLGPPERRIEDGPLDMAAVEKSWLEWGVDVLAPGEGLDRIPKVPADDPWAMQRLPDANVLRTDARVEPRLGPQEHEKFLFYRGLGRFDLPLRAHTHADGSITLSNGGTETIRSLFVLHVRDGAARWIAVPEAPAGGAVEIPALPLDNAGSVAAMIADLRPALEAALVAEGLYPKEAESMARTWERSYFHSEGLRILYMVPRPMTDRILPIALDPPPAELVRVLVGRLECVTPAEEAAVETALREWASGDGPTHARGEAGLRRLGRFLEPHLRRALTTSKDPAVIATARELLATPRSAGSDSLKPREPEVKIVPTKKELKKK